MKPKTIFILLILFICLLTGTIFIVKHKGIGHKKKTVGIYIFSDLPVDKIYEIDIRGADTQVSLIKREGIWTVKEHFSYMADFSQISDLIEKLRSVNIGQSFEADRNILRRLVLMDPDDPKAKEDEKGRALILKAKDGNIIKKIIFGKAMRSGEAGFPNGQYIRFSKNNTVYLIDQYFTSLIQGPMEWIRLDLLDIKSEDIKKIAGYKKKGCSPEYLLIKDKEDDKFKIKKEPKAKKIEDNILKRLKDGLDYLRIEDVLDPSTDPASVGIYPYLYVEYELYNGMIYRIYPSKICNKDNICYIKISVSYNGSDKELSNRAKELNKRLNPWIYKISKWRHESFFLP